LGRLGRIWHRSRLFPLFLLWFHTCQQSPSWLSENRSTRNQSCGLQIDRPRPHLLCHSSSSRILLGRLTLRHLQHP
jgi:hypothetical protein